MPLIGPSRLGLLTFPQRWEPGTLTVRFLCLPKGDPETPLTPGQPAFAAANLVFEANVISGLDRLPRAADANRLGQLVLDDPPVKKAALFSELTQQFRIVPRTPAPPPPGPQELNFRKAVTDSYRALTGNRQLSKYLVSQKDFECALQDAQDSQPATPSILDDTITWGRLIALALRQPKLATALGLIGQAAVELPDPNVFDVGGWLFIGLHAASDYAAAGPGLMARYAARIPPLDRARSLYAAVLFQVDGATVADDVFREAERYDLGFAHLVHGAQSEDRPDAIRLAWDDEQVAEWLNRQVAPKAEAPMGTAGYRVDVRRPGGDWNSLVRMASVGDLMLGPHMLGSYEGEAVVEVIPAQIAPTRAGQFWMPPYFTSWRGTSLALSDPDLARLHEHPALANPDAAAYRLNREKTFVPVNEKAVPLLYGSTYQFRVRLADLTHGGPPSTDETPDVPDAVATVLFQRRTRPGPVTVIRRPTQDDTQLIIAKPRLGYPDALFTGAVTFADLQADLDLQREREMSVPDPDVLQVEILVEVRSLEGDVAPFLPLYTTARELDADEMTIDLVLEDYATLDLLAAVQPDNGPLALPTVRNVRLTLTAIGRDDPGYFASAEARRGVPTTVEIRAAAKTESPLFLPVDMPLRSFFFQAPPDDDAVPRPAEWLAQEVGLDHYGLTLAGRAGRRMVMACSAALRHTPSPERAAFTLASGADVIQRWINVLHFRLTRDWSWDGLAEEGIAVRRRVKRTNQPEVVELAGTIRLPHVLAPAGKAGIDGDPRNRIRQSTDILFFDAVDPKPKTGEHPSEITVEYDILPAFKDSVPASVNERRSIRLPITTPPAQVPRLVSAGFALSTYEAADDYSSTMPRRRMLWLEFEAPPTDPEDAFFVRVLANAPDPMLTDEEIPEVREPALPVDPEWMRLILPGQPRDDSGLGAMQPLVHQADAGPHYLVPLPAGMTATSLELFGMFYVYLRDTNRPHREPLVDGAGTLRAAASGCWGAASCAAARLPGRAFQRPNPRPRPVCNPRAQRPQRASHVSEDGAVGAALCTCPANRCLIVSQPAACPRGTDATAP